MDERHDDRDAWFVVLNDDLDENIEQPAGDPELPEVHERILRRLRGQAATWRNLGLTPSDTTAYCWRGRMWFTIDCGYGCLRADVADSSWEIAWAKDGCAVAYDHPYLKDIAASKLIRGELANPNHDIAEMLDHLLAHLAVRPRYLRRHDRRR